MVGRKLLDATLRITGGGWSPDGTLCRAASALWNLESFLMQSCHPAVTEIQMSADAAECPRLRKIVRRLASAALGSSHAAADVELAVGEAFGNAVKYGVPRSKISVRLEASSGRELSVQLDYPGSRFDTTTTYPKDLANANGGFGRFIMERVTSGMEYSFKDGRTILRMTKRE